MQNILFARQPIFYRDRSLFGYELLFRVGLESNAVCVDSDLATQAVLLNAYTHADTLSSLNQKPGLLNVNKSMLNIIPDFLSHSLIIEIPENYHGDADLVQLLTQLKGRGFRLALDNFELKAYRLSLMDMVDIVKVDVSVKPKEEILAVVERLENHNLQLVAEKVEDYSMYQYCLELGFDLFQGYFFCQPETISGHRLDANKTGLLTLLAELYKPNIELQDIQKLVRADAVLSYQLLQLVNSAFYRRVRKVDSIQQAVILLGIDRIRSWATLINLGRLEDKPKELQREALTRAFLTEHIALVVAPEQQHLYFTAGLLSLLDAWLDSTMTNILCQLPLEDELMSALIERRGLAGKALATSIAYCHSDWQSLDVFWLEQHDIAPQQLTQWYIQATKQADLLLAK